MSLSFRQVTLRAGVVVALACPLPAVWAQAPAFGNDTGAIGIGRLYTTEGKISASGHVYAVPEPATWTLWIGGLVALRAFGAAGASRRRPR